MDFPIFKLPQEKIERLFPVLPTLPKQIYIRGKLPGEHTKKLTVIGSRKFSHYGADTTKHLIASLRGYPVSIVSGLALGIDAIALRSAIDAGLHTIAIPGSGIDDNVLTPRSNLELARTILSTGGAVMSEWEPTMVSAVWTFPHRNRLMAAMADAVLVIEAENKSGTRITAKLATDYNIDVLAVPGPIFSSTSEGTNNLIREGATPITSPEDLLSALSFEPTKTERDVRIDECSPLEQKIWNIVASPTSRDGLIRTIGAATHEITMALSVMEIKGLIKEVYGEIRRT